MRQRVADGGRPVYYLDFGGSGRPALMARGPGGKPLHWMAVGLDALDAWSAYRIPIAAAVS